MDAVGGLDGLCANALHVEKECAVVAGLHSHHRRAAERLRQRRVCRMNAPHDGMDVRRQERPFRTADRQRGRRKREGLTGRGDGDARLPRGAIALGQRDAERESVGIEVALCVRRPIVERDDVDRRSRVAPQRRGIAGVEQLGRHEQRNHAARRGKSKSPLDEGDRKIGLMKGRAARAVTAKESEALAVHSFGARLDAAVAYPGWIADHDVETAARHHVGEVNVEGEEADLAVLDAFDRAEVRANALVQFAAAIEIDLAQTAEEIALRCAELLLLALVEVDRLGQELTCQPAVVRAEEACDGRPLPMRRAAVTLDEVGLRA